MRFGNQFTIPTPPSEAWALPRIALCSPGVLLAGLLAANRYRGEKRCN